MVPRACSPDLSESTATSVPASSVRCHSNAFGSPAMSPSVRRSGEARGLPYPFSRAASAVPASACELAQRAVERGDEVAREDGDYHADDGDEDEAAEGCPQHSLQPLPALPPPGLSLAAGEDGAGQ